MPINDKKKDKKNEFINILEIPLIIVKRWWLIAIIAFIATIFSIIYSGRIKEKFESYVEIELRSRFNNNINSINKSIGLLDNMTEAAFNQSTTEVELYAHIAQTPRIIDKIIIKNDLKTVYKLDKMSVLRKRFRSKLQVVVNEMGLLYIRYEDEDKMLAFNIINDYIDELQEYYKWRSQEIMKSSLNEIDDIIKQVREEINVEQNKLKEFQKKYGIFDVDTYAEDLAVQIADLKAQQIQAQLEYNFHYSEYRRLGTKSLMELKVDQDKIDYIQNEIDELKNITNDNHVAFNDLPQINLEYIEININLKSLYLIYDQVRLLYNITKLNIDKNVESIVIVNKPEIAEEKFYPNRTRIVLVNFIISIFFGIFICFIIEFFQRSYKKEEDRKIILEIKDHILFWRKIPDYVSNLKKIKNKISKKIVMKKKDH